MFKSLLNLASDIVALPLDAAVDVARRVVSDPASATEESRVGDRLELIADDVDDLLEDK